MRRYKDTLIAMGTLIARQGALMRFLSESLVAELLKYRRCSFSQNRFVLMAYDQNS